MDNDKYYMDNEIWKVYKTTYAPRWGHRVYEVSNLGRVKLNGEIVKPYITGGGYLTIAHFTISRAVAELYIPNPENKPCVDHINTIRTDNRVENLRWVSYKENQNNPLSLEHHRNLSKETRQKLSAAHKGPRHHMYGKHHSEETKAKMSAAKKGKPNGKLGMHHSEETKEKIRQARLRYSKRKKEI